MRLFSIGIMSLGLVGCAHEAAPQKAPASSQNVAYQGAFEAKSGATLMGKVTFTEAGSLVTAKIDVENAPPGEHAVHIHENGDCSSPDGKSAGGHWNPTTDEHGKWTAEHHHLGDIGNMIVGPDGKGTITLTTDRWALGTGAANDPLGRSVIVHGGVDDFHTQPTGNAGNRIGCAKIEK
jgi:Cu-Zn family superoxide dismutase